MNSISSNVSGIGFLHGIYILGDGMPELPEVEVVCNGLRKDFIGARLSRVDVRQAALRYPVTDGISQLCKGSRVSSVTRRAKYLLLGLSKGCILIHLGMSGCLRVTSSKVPPGKHDLVDIVLQDDLILRFHDPRRFGCLLYAEKPDDFSCLHNLGCEPLSREFCSKYFRQVLVNRRSSIKSCLMNSTIVVGIGNIYANESLFEARIHPLRQADSLTSSELSRLVTAIKAVLRRAIKRGGTTLRDFLNVSGEQGKFQNSLRVYGKAGTICSSCLSQEIEVVRTNQRSTFFCQICQK
ncbi:bifunctional DNA-formamidopyrimidine glycosylase/DNA-(apurinic or apyrimidinic site) lyase [Candidatus Ichthyocystis hellenicum]|uniref:bifunctional DNA-formamidopyrimidine glycosylase/DNA-(apurinic or apyrimidinic site) lyase n=1 Tax=Candidatus Ichthyocystis hellenicum TaxID=1561003 RepID=UPI000B26DF56|nr:bifunctional DNA-formamidopyrimidine glycosylase/DNA-(apurinic or apyrimidinic site) lyase [Candidatus Ichthyocystis hellenicum]